MASLFRRILVPHDFSSHANRALKLAADLARDQRGGRLRVLHVIPPFTPMAGLPPAEMGAYIPPANLIADERAHLERVVGKAVAGRGAPAVECQVVIGDPHHRIVDACRGMDAVVMATTGRTGLAHLLIGSVAEKVVRHAPIPVLTLRPPGTRAARVRTPKRAGRPRKGR